MTKRQRYLYAYKQIATGKERFSCHAVGRLNPRQTAKDTLEVRAYQAVFCPEGDDMDFLFKIQRVTCKNTQESINLRVLMLSLMAVCYKDFE